MFFQLSSDLLLWSNHECFDLVTILLKANDNFWMLVTEFRCETYSPDIFLSKPFQWISKSSMYDGKFNLCDFWLNFPLWILGFKMIRNGSSWTNRSWCWMWLEQRSVEKHGQLRLDFTNFHELKPFLKYIKGHKLKNNFTLVEKLKAPGYIQFVLKYMEMKFSGKKKVDS